MFRTAWRSRWVFPQYDPHVPHAVLAEPKPRRDRHLGPPQQHLGGLDAARFGARAVSDVDVSSRGLRGASMARPASICYSPAMPDDLYHRDALAWSEYQADLLRRVARGERVNEVDWEHVIEEIEDVGLSELHAVESYLDLIFVHLLKIGTWPVSDATNHWRAELVSFQSNALRRFAPSMRQRLDSASAYRSAVRQVTLLNGGKRPDWWPAEPPFTIEELLNEECVALEQRLSAAPPASAVD
jgi:hypothetical protein